MNFQFLSKEKNKKFYFSVMKKETNPNKFMVNILVIPFYFYLFLYSTIGLIKLFYLEYKHLEDILNNFKYLYGLLDILLDKVLK